MIDVPILCWTCTPDENSCESKSRDDPPGMSFRISAASSHRGNPYVFSQFSCQFLEKLCSNLAGLDCWYQWTMILVPFWTLDHFWTIYIYISPTWCIHSRLSPSGCHHIFSCGSPPLNHETSWVCFQVQISKWFLGELLVSKEERTFICNGASLKESS